MIKKGSPIKKRLTDWILLLASLPLAEEKNNVSNINLQAFFIEPP